MAYNNFPIWYQPAQIFYPQQQQPIQQHQPIQQPSQQMLTPPTIHAEIIQVDNEQVAENHPMQAGTSQMMIAKDDSAIFVKTMYANGQYNMDTYVKRPNSPKKPEIDMGAYITRDEFENRLKEILKAPEGKKVKKDVDV